MYALIFGDDKVSRKAWLALEPHIDKQQWFILKDGSNDFKRVINLLIKKRIRLKHFLKMLWAEVSRPSHPKIYFDKVISSNTELIDFLHQEKIQKIVLFRCGLIISKSLLKKFPFVFNCHASDINKFGGLASIARALDAGELSQVATLHKVTSRIDDGDKLIMIPFSLNPDISYPENESIAYDALITVLLNACRIIQNKESFEGL